MYSPDFKAQIEKYCDVVNTELMKYIPEANDGQRDVTKAMRYSLSNGGKRLRPIFVLEFCRMCGGDVNKALPYACAIEYIHTYSLIHDDLPCMDNDDVRRGKPSCHKAFDYATAMLAGDALAGCGLEVIANDDSLPDSLKIKAVQAAARAMGPKGMIYGQELDLEYEDKPADKETLTKIHRHKTGKMISLCGELGSLGCELTAGQKDALTLFFDNIGIVFQIIDDVLDVEGDATQLGKPVGSDEENNKSTFVSLYGLEKSKEIAREMTARADSRLKAAFGEKADLLIEYTKYLLSRNK